MALTVMGLRYCICYQPCTPHPLTHVIPPPPPHTHTQAGLVIAGQSTKNSEYLYSWTHDSAFVFKLLIEGFVSVDHPSLRPLIDAYISVGATIQQITNPSGIAGKSGLSASPLMAPHLLLLEAVRSEVCAGTAEIVYQFQHVRSFCRSS